MHNRPFATAKKIEAGLPWSVTHRSMAKWVIALLAGVALVSGPALAQEEQPKQDPPTEQPKPTEPKVPPPEVTPKPSTERATDRPWSNRIPASTSEANPESKQATAGKRQPVEETPKGPVTGAPGIRCAEPVKDFGEQWGSEDLTHSYVIRNEGDQVLKIERVKPSCGCTLAGQYDKEIAPGAEGKVPISLKTSKLHNKFTKYITVDCNDPVTPSLRLKITGTIKQYVEADPARITFSHITEDSTHTGRTRITANTDEKLELSFESEQQIGPFHAELAEIEPGKVFELVVQANPPYQYELNQANFVLKTSVSKQETVEVVVTAYLPPRIVTDPKVLFLSAAPETDQRQLIKLTNNGDTDVKVLSAQTNDEKIQVEVTEKTPGKIYELAVVIPSGYLPPSTGKMVTITTDDPNKQTIDVPIRVRQQRDKYPAKKLVGKPLPEATFSTSDGATLTTGELRDKVVVLDFYASWCGYSQKQLRAMDGLFTSKYADNPQVRFLAVSMDTLKEPDKPTPNRRARTVEQVVATFAKLASFDNVLDTQGLGRSSFLVQNFPTLMVIGADGTIEAVHFGLPKAYDLASVVGTEIDLLLQGKTRADFPGAEKQ